jgi:acetyl-CoA acetyltransferase
MKHPLHDIAIVGAHNTRQAKSLAGETSHSITLEAVRGALADAGLKVSDIDGVNVTQGLGLPIIAMDWRISPHQFLDGAPAFLGEARPGIAAVLEAAAAIAAGYCETVVVATGQAGEYVDRTATAPWTRPDNEFVEAFGLYSAAEWALLARRHMALFGTKPEALAEVAATIRNNGAINPEAVHYGRGPYTAQDVLDSRMIADPFHVLDCSLTSEGGCAIVLTTAERARDLPGDPVYLWGGAREVRGPIYARPPVWDDLGWIGSEAAARTFGMAGIGPTDIDVCEFYDPFSFEIIHQFEAFGFCERGEGGDFVMDGRIALDGEFPVATDGGALSHGHAGNAQLLQKIVAAVRQLRGTAAERQVAGATTAFVSNDGFTARGCMILGQDQA